LNGEEVRKLREITRERGRNIADLRKE